MRGKSPDRQGRREPTFDTPRHSQRDDDDLPAFDSANPDPARSNAPYRVFNIGNNSPVKLMEFIDAIEAAVGKPAQKNFLPLQDGDVPATFADVSELTAWTGFKPAMPVTEGISRFVRWYREYFKV